MAGSSWSPSAAAKTLPTTLTPDVKNWWASRYGNQKLLDAVAHRGTRDNNAMTFVRGKFLTEFMDDVYGHLELSKQDKEWYEGQVLGNPVYQHVYRAAQRFKVTGRAYTPAAPRPTKIKHRADPHDYWRRENPELYATLKADHEAEHGQLNFGASRGFNLAAFKAQGKDVIEKFEKLAKEDLAAVRAIQMIDDPELRAKYVVGLLKEIKTALHHAEVTAGVQMSVQILTPLGNSQYKLSSIVSKGLMEFAKSGPLEDFLGAMQDFVEESGSNRVHGGPVRIAIICDFSKAKFPFFPDIPSSIRQDALRALFRSFVTIVWVFYGGTKQVAWEEIGRDVDKWIDPECRPPDAIWKDPGSMPRAPLLVWVCWIHNAQAGKHKNLGEEVRREFVECNNRTECHLIFDRPVTRSHAVGDLPYGEANFAYAAHLAAAKAQSTPKPDHWLGLPTIGPHTKTSVLHDEEEATIRALSATTAPEVRERIEKIVECIKEHQRLIPATTPKGVWAHPSTLPIIIPPSIPTNPVANPFSPLWPPIHYFRASPNVPFESTIQFFWAFVEVALTTGLLHHEESGTLLGGDSGMIQIIRPLLVLLFYLLAIRGNITLPETLPAELNVSTLPVKMYDRLLEWIDASIEALDATNAILRKTSEERSAVRFAGDEHAPAFEVAEIADLPPESDEPMQPPVAGRASSATPRPSSSSKRSKPRPRPKPKSSKAKGKRPMRSAESESESDGSAVSSKSGSDVPSIDYDKLDKRPDDDDDDDDDDTAWLGDNSGDIDSISRDLRVTGDEGGATTSDKPKNLVFGALPVLPLHEPPEFNTASQAIAALQDFEREATSTIAALHNLGGTAPVWDGEHREDAKAYAARWPSEAQPVYELIYLRRLAWASAETAAPCIRSHARHLLNALRNCVVACGYAERIARLHGEARTPMVQTLMAQVDSSKKLAARVKWIYHELETFQLLATSWFDRLELAWRWEDPPCDLAKLRSFGLLHTQWADEVATTCSGFLAERSLTLADLKIPQDDPILNTPIIWYRFACPTANEEPAGLRASLGQPLQAASPATSPPQAEATGAKTGPAAGTSLPSPPITLPNPVPPSELATSTPPPSNPSPSPSQPITSPRPVPPSGPATPALPLSNLSPSQPQPAQPDQTTVPVQQPPPAATPSSRSAPPDPTPSVTPEETSTGASAENESATTKKSRKRAAPASDEPRRASNRQRSTVSKGPPALVQKTQVDAPTTQKEHSKRKSGTR
ncbi:hypothetical protein FS749_013927 [Ceratobasidium sp. UAMH 11750]|nr:hypothetical protein FS749_013927 [Ceratobasidium sp. UAMH 11750]